jgi:hypothetical protein
MDENEGQQQGRDARVDQTDEVVEQEVGDDLGVGDGAQVQRFEPVLQKQEKRSFQQQEMKWFKGT